MKVINWKRTARVLPVLVVTLLAGVSVRAGPELRFVVGPITTTELGTLGGAQSMANDINIYGDIVGWAETATGVRHAVLYTDGSAIDVGFALGETESEAFGINRYQVIVGFSGGVVPDRRAFRWARGALTHLDKAFSLIRGTQGSTAYAVSDSGLIVGSSSIQSWGKQATAWTASGEAHLLSAETPSSLPPDTVAQDINSRGYVVGHEGRLDTATSWKLYLPEMVRKVLPSLDGMGGLYASEWYPRGVNEWNEIVGSTSTRSRPWRGDHAAYLGGGDEILTELGVLPTGTMSIADDINNQHFIAGFADMTVWLGGKDVDYLEARTEAAFIYHPDFGMYDLPKPESVTPLGNCRATALNDMKINGLIQVVGYCEKTDGLSAVRWDVMVAKRPLTE